MHVSVITPCYNSAPFLAEVLESVASQKKIDHEHIVIDDCSTDNSREILEQYSEKLPRLKVIYLSENIGQARARNAGLDVAQGEYVAFLDSDDYYLNDTALVRWYEAAKKNDAEIVRCNYQRLDERTKKIVNAENAFVGRNDEGICVDTSPELVNNTSCWLLLYKRAFLNDNDIRFSTLLRQREDRPFFLLALLHAKTVNLIGDSLIVYRVREGSTMRTVSWEQLDLFSTHLKVVSDYMTRFAGDSSRAPFRRANLLYYVKNILEYWAPLLKRPDALLREEVTRFFEASQTLAWNVGELRADTVLDRVDPEKRDSYFYDFTRILLQRGLASVFHHFLRDARIPLADASIIFPDEQPSGDLNWEADRQTIYHYFRRNPPLITATAKPSRFFWQTQRQTIVLHAGMTKTGSSSLQTFFEENRFLLYRKYGVYYPFTGLEHGAGAREHRTSGHAGLVQSVLHGQTVAVCRMLDEIASLPNPPRIVFLSAENIVSERFWRNGDAARALATAFKDTDLRIVVYFRRQEEWLESAYVESVTSPGLRYSRSPGDFAEDQRRCGLLDFIAVDAAWRRYFNRDKLTYRSYEIARAEGDTIDDFLPLLGINDRAAGVPRPSGMARNESVPKVAAYLIRHLNALEIPRQLAVKLNAEIVSAAQQITFDSGKGPDIAFFSEEDRNALASLYDLGNRAFFNEYFPSSPPYTPRPGLASIADSGCIHATLLDGFLKVYKAAICQDTTFSEAENSKLKPSGAGGNEPKAVGKVKGDTKQNAVRQRAPLTQAKQPPLKGVPKTNKLKPSGAGGNEPKAVGKVKGDTKQDAVRQRAPLPRAEMPLPEGVPKMNRPDQVLAAYIASPLTIVRRKLNKVLRKVLTQAVAIDQSGAFDRGYYLKQDSTAEHYPGGPIMHYLEIGASRGLDPSPNFSTSAYLSQNADVAAAKVNALYHYITYGRKEGRSAT